MRIQKPKTPCMESRANYYHVLGVFISSLNKASDRDLLEEFFVPLLAECLVDKVVFFILNMMEIGKVDNLNTNHLLVLKTFLI